MRAGSRFGFFVATAVALVWSLLPIYWFCRMSLMTPGEAARFPQPLIPGNINFSAFFAIMGSSYTLADGSVINPSGLATAISRGLVNSLIVSVSVTVLTLLIALPLAYVFARLEFRHKNKLLFAILLAVAIPPVSTLIPFYTMYVRLGLSGTLTGLVIVDLTITVPFVAWMMIGYFRNLPPIERLARIDGYGLFGAFALFVVPMAKGGVAVAAVIAFLFAWNEFAFALVLVNATTANTLPAAISGFLFQQPEPANLAASVVLAMVPPALFAYYLQNHVAEMNIVDPVR